MKLSFKIKKSHGEGVYPKKRKTCDMKSISNMKAAKAKKAYHQREEVFFRDNGVVISSLQIIDDVILMKSQKV